MKTKRVQQAKAVTDFRLNLRIDPAERARVHKAARKRHLTMAAFVRQCALDAADRILGDVA